MAAGDFNPPIFLRNPRIQTYLASSSLRTNGKNPMVDASKDVVIDAGSGIRLLAGYSKNMHSKGTVILFHGWEGSIDSAYILSAGRFLFNNGFSVFRLNFRDHGKSHHLNKGLFYATLIDEVFAAVKTVSEITGDSPLFLAGFSLGGNFALRIGQMHSIEPVKNLCHIVSISPVINPDKATSAIDRNMIIRRYFLLKWRRSLSLKQKLYPELYDFNGIIPLKSCRSITDRLIEHYSSYKDAAEYFRCYTITNSTLNDIRIPTTIITSKDDPVIPVDDFYSLNAKEPVNLIIHRYGGHNGFINNLSFDCWYEEKMIRLFEESK
ncbi:MAG: alpha/beta fold hydrolase [Proteobacteria bacterium]|nr:alpha/beta fold hydrolase [Pseudomonadota bacterium]